MENPYLQEGEEVFEELKDVKSVPQAKSKKKKAGYCVLAIVLAFLCFFGGFGVCWLSLDSEMRSLIRLKDKMQEEYYKDISDEQFYDTIFGAINDNLLDDYSAYMTAEEYDAIISAGKGNNSGIGVALITKTDDEQDVLYIRRICGNSPAEKAGLAIGDCIVGFGTNPEQMIRSVSYAEFNAFLSKRENNEKFYLQVENSLGLKTVEIYKTSFLENCVFYRTNDSSYRFTGDDKEDRVAVGISLAMPNDWAYIRLTQFNKNASDEFDGAMELFKAEGKKHLVLDLRGNGGGYMGVLQSIAKYFCKDASTRRPIVAVADYGEDKETFKADGNEYYEYFSSDSRICVLADVETASASECLIGCMLDYGAISYADICLSSRFGETKTFGKGIMQTTYPIRLLKGDAVRLTTATVHWPVSNRCIHGRGVLPEDGTKTASGNYTDDELKNAFLALGIN